MAKTNLKRMNRFELLELMYKLVVENESLTRRCAELERQLNYGSRGGEYRSARESPRDYYDEPRTVSRRDEIFHAPGVRHRSGRAMMPSAARWTRAESQHHLGGRRPPRQDVQQHRLKRRVHPPG